MDNVFNDFLEAQLPPCLALANESDVLTLRSIPRPDGPPQHFLARFDNCGLICTESGEIRRAPFCVFGITFGDDYLKHTNTFELITLLAPVSLFHSNIKYPRVCLGAGFARPGTQLLEILYRLHQFVTYQLWTASDPLNEEAAQWLRNHQDQVPLSGVPLKRRTGRRETGIVKTEGRP